MLAPALGIGLTLALPAAGAMAQMPSPLWRGVSHIVLACSASVDPALCQTIGEAARGHSALPVTLAPHGALSDGTRPDRGAVIVTIELDDDRRSLVAVARRALEIDDAEGPARYAVAWNAAAPMAAISDLLNRILPHRSARGRRLE
ncbi:hypothetical protein U1701_17045 [Sphingomonas sp. PB2P19]|uniref:hypothetical protein n=1 Tax=Sphingomonas rhamnosi TaxID=3096156 RepID=UPI002FC5C193